jgi:hypothetical protein
VCAMAPVAGDESVSQNVAQVRRVWRNGFQALYFVARCPWMNRRGAGSPLEAETAVISQQSHDRTRVPARTLAPVDARLPDRPIYPELSRQVGCIVPTGV